jgi:hypothetical protein
LRCTLFPKVALRSTAQRVETLDQEITMLDRELEQLVELYSRLAWVGSLLDDFEPTDDDPRRRRLSRSSPAVQLQGEFDDAWLGDSLVTIAQLAERLDRGSLQLALRIVPLEWWATRAGPAPARSGVQSAAPTSQHPSPERSSRPSSGTRRHGRRKRVPKYLSNPAL